MRIIDEIILYENPEPLLVSKQGIFPDCKITRQFLTCNLIGQAFDSADHMFYIIIYIKIRKNQNPLNHYCYKIINY